jgi:hypothetical protein
MIPGETVQSSKALGMEVDPHLSEYQVLRSHAGYYVGTTWNACGRQDCSEEECSWGEGFSQPGSRETDYFETREEAEKALEGFKKNGELEGDRSNEGTSHQPSAFMVAVAQLAVTENDIYDRETGIKAVEELFAYGGQPAVGNEAAIAWDKFDNDEKLKTTKAHKFFVKNKVAPKG